MGHNSSAPDAPLVLVVDDDLDIAEAIGDLLALAGYRTELALDGRAALERVARGAFCMVLLDWRLPDEPSGAELVRRLRETAGAIPIVVLSADPVSLEEARSSAITGSLAKPFDNQGLLAVVALHAGPPR